jgi:pimeloyl-ACP methyl ester carboxylesterase
LGWTEGPDYDPEAIAGFATHAIYLGLGNSNQSTLLICTGAERDYRKYLQNISAPCLVIHGNQDLVQKGSDTRIYSENIPNAEFCSVQGGHFFLEENSSEVSDKIRKFIS